MVHQQKKLSPELYQDYDAIFETTSSKGWELIVASFQEAWDNRNNILNLKNEMQLYQAQGALSVIYRIINYREFIRQEYDNVVAEAEGDAGDKDPIDWNLTKH